MGFSVFARSVLRDEARVSLACRIAEKIAPGRGEVDDEGSLRRLFRRGWVCAFVALRSPFRRRLDDHLGDDKSALPAARFAWVHEIVEVFEARGGRRRADFQPL